MIYCHWIVETVFEKVCEDLLDTCCSKTVDKFGKNSCDNMTVILILPGENSLVVKNICFANVTISKLSHCIEWVSLLCLVDYHLCCHHSHPTDQKYTNLHNHFPSDQAGDASDTNSSALSSVVSRCSSMMMLMMLLLVRMIVMMVDCQRMMMWETFEPYYVLHFQ